MLYNQQSIILYNLLNEPKLTRKCKYLCLVGGLSCSKYFQYKMQEAFGMRSKYMMTVITPNRPILSVVEGAAYFGITDNYIKARVLPHTYGQIMCREEEYVRASGVSEDFITKK